ncbi:hypothetical protein BV22DRAFT_167479 [Leucogyrophana mollusca]|uniref:Uncharacterized protein n=1 Tax=Leucogyrophana mollusca TaxID=85980 RepID=A0ACB8BWF5_9AGAM|nr:hypothetical protein BV22DRAFT_167479 [Leucogyrophana mollusca]
MPPRRYDARSRDDMDVDRRPPLASAARSGALDTRPPPLDDRRPPPLDDRTPRAPPSDDRDRAVRPPIDDRSTRPPLPVSDMTSPSTEDRLTRPPPSVNESGAGSRPGADERPSARPIAPTTDERGPRPAIPADERSVRAPIPLEERITQPPSLQDRLSQPPVARVVSRADRQPSLEERLSHAPVASSNDRPPPSDDRPARAGPPEPSRGAQNDRAAPPDDRGRPPVNDRFARPVTPPQDRAPLARAGGYAPPPRSASVVRDDLRVSKDSPADRTDVRDYRASRDVSRERPDVRPYRADVDRSFGDDRRTDAMDVTAPPRFVDSRGPPPYRRLSPPPATDTRGRGYFPPRSPPRDPPYEAETDRRFGGGEPRDWQFDRRRDWNSAADEDKFRPPAWRSWDRNPAADRDRFDRDAPPPVRGNGWDDRGERRPAYPGSPVRSIDGGARPLSSRLNDSYPPGNDDRAYPPRDLDRSRYPSALEGSPSTFSRVRGRSPSPLRRGGGNSMDDLRPPLKRAREDAPYPSGYYSPPRRGSITGEYPARSIATPPPSSGGSSTFYDSRGGPPPPFSGGSVAGGPPLDRDYAAPRDRVSDLPPIWKEHIHQTQ